MAYIIARVPPIDDDLADQVFAADSFIAMANTPGIDDGEAILVGMLQISQDPNVLVTGDKRFVAALRVHFPDVFCMIRGRLLTFEKCLRMICDARGTAYVVDHVAKAATCDGTLRAALGTNHPCDEVSFLKALKSFDPASDTS